MITQRFIRDAAVLQAGTIVGTLIQAVSGVLIARFLQPELFGKYSIAFSVASIVTIFLGAGVQDAIAPQVARAWATGDRESLRDGLGFWARFTAANIIATLAVVVFLPLVTGHLYQSRILGGYAAVIVIASLISTTVFTVAQLMLQVAGEIRSLSLLTLTDVAVRYGSVIGLILAGYGIWGAVGGHLIGALLLLMLSIAAYRMMVRTFPEIPSLTDVAVRAQSVPWRPLLTPTLWVMVDRNLGMLYGALPVALIGLYASTVEVAYFKLAFGYFMLAMTALGPVSTLLNVHFPTVQVTDRRQLRTTFIRVTFLSTLLTMGITVVVLGLAPLVFRLLYGPLYGPAVPYVYGLGIFGALFGLGVGLGPMWRAVNRVHVSIIINLLTLGAGVPLGIWMMMRWHVWGAVAMVTLWYTVSHIISFAYLMISLKSDMQSARI
jgi:O-antigen/teichoic acid export membrane protein